MEEILKQLWIMRKTITTRAQLYIAAGSEEQKEALQEQKYVALRISSYFKTKVDKLQFCLMEFSQEGTHIRCNVGNPWWVD